ncbi:MAG: cytidine deaminase [Lachnospiraceae bacterium]|nr:cytidine deaminase [Lachnospiraceae bacterium]
MISSVNQDIIRQMIQEAKAARAFSYSPYSNYAVGAALLTKDGTIISGCNIENAAYSPGICAERNAIYKAVSEGYKSFVAIAIVAGQTGEDVSMDYPAPCGVCRQVMREFVNPNEFTVYMAKSEDDYRQCTLEELLPMSFGPEYLSV